MTGLGYVLFYLKACNEIIDICIQREKLNYLLCVIILKVYSLQILSWNGDCL